MFDYVKLLLKKYTVVLHIDDNDAVNNPWRTVLDNFLSLYILLSRHYLILECEITFSVNITNEHLPALLLDTLPMRS